MSTPKKKKTSPGKGIPKKTDSAKTGFSFKEELASRKPVLRFWAGFASLVIFFFIITATPFYINYIFQPVVNAFAWAGSIVLNIFGQGTTVDNELISSSTFAINISKGCDGLAPIALLVSGILIYPSKWKYKWPGILAGTGILIFLNLIRIISLFFIGAYAPKIFDLMHVEVWQAIFIIIAVALWLIWLNWVLAKLKAERASAGV